MKLEDQVCSLELAKRLKDLGVRQESVFYWNFFREHIEWDDSWNESWSITTGPSHGRESFAAFTVAELIEKIEGSANEWALGYNDSGCFYHFVKGERGTGSRIEICEQKDSRFDSEATPFVNAIAEWVIHLIEKGLMKP